MRRLTFLSLILPLQWAALGADLSPVIQWIRTTGGSGNSSVAAAVADPRGNLYIAGSTTSLDFPTMAAAQAVAGGSMLVRINLANGNATRLFPANLVSITAAAAALSNPGTLYAASGNQIFKSTDAGSTWSMVFQFASGVSVFGMAVDPSNANTVYAASTTLGILKSVDGGVTWTASNSGIPALPNGSINVRNIWVDPSQPQVLFVSTNSGLLRSADGGNSWTMVSSSLSPNVLSFDPNTAGTLYVSSFNSILKSSDDGLTFGASTSLPSNAAVFALAPDPHQAGVVYAGATDGIYQSSDGGVTWNQKIAGVASALAADPNSNAFYARLSTYGIVKSTDGFATTTPIGPNEPLVQQLIVSGPNLYEISAASTDAFAVKFDNNGNVVYSTYFGGSGSEVATAAAVGADGSFYVAGSTTSADLPVTAGAYLSKAALTNGTAGSFVLKLNPDGSVAWATYLTGPGSSVASIAVDSQGNVLAGGYTSGGLQTTAGAYQTTFQQSEACTGFIGCFAGPTSAFVIKLNAQGSGVIFSTYIATDNRKNLVQGAQAMVVDAAGNVWIGVSVNPNVVPSGGTNTNVVELNAAGSAVLASAVQPGLGNVAALALDAGSNVYVAGAFGTQGVPFPATPGAFQPAPQPALPVLSYQPPAGGGQDAFVAKFDSSLTHLLAATLLGGELPDTATSVAVDASGTVIVGGYTDSKAFPTHAPFQELFSSRSGFAAGFDASLSKLLFSTYVGDQRPFAVEAVAPDGNGNIFLAGMTLNPGTAFFGGDNGASYSVGNLVVVNKIALQAGPALRLDSVQNYASHFASPLAPGEPILALGAGFGDGAQIVVDGSPLVTVASTATSLVAVMPDDAATSGAHTVQVSNNGILSNSVYVAAAPAAPGIFSADGSGAGQGYILNSDGTMNSPSNPAAPGSAITIFAAGAGQYTLTDGYAVTMQTPAVFIDGFYANGIAARIGPVAGLPGNVYQLSVYIPDVAALVNANPDLKNFKFPAQSPIQLVMGPSNALNFANSQAVSQNGLFISIQ